MIPAFICLECGALFDEPKRYIERYDPGSQLCEEISVCPVCGGTYTRTIFCDACGEPITGDYVKIGLTGDCYCDACFMLKSLDDR